MIGRVMVAAGVPQDLARAVAALTENPILILLLVNAFLIVVGMIMDDLSVTVVIAPLFMPLVGAVAFRTTSIRRSLSLEPDQNNENLHTGHGYARRRFVEYFRHIC